MSKLAFISSSKLAEEAELPKLYLQQVIKLGAGLPIYFLTGFGYKNIHWVKDNEKGTYKVDCIDKDTCPLCKLASNKDRFSKSFFRMKTYISIAAVDKSVFNITEKEKHFQICIVYFPGAIWKSFDKLESAQSLNKWVEIYRIKEDDLPYDTYSSFEVQVSDVYHDFLLQTSRDKYTEKLKNIMKQEGFVGFRKF